MRIGRLRAGLRQTSVEPAYYGNYSEHEIAGKSVNLSMNPFNGEVFLSFEWMHQEDRKWMGRSSDGIIPAASLGCLFDWERHTQKRQRDSSFLATFFYCSNEMRITVGYDIELSGMWLQSEEPFRLVTVLETTRLKVKFRAEMREAVLPPGTVAVISPDSFMKKFPENLGVISRTEIKEDIFKRILIAFALSRTPKELAEHLKLEPIRLREKLVSREGLVGRRGIAGVQEEAAS